MNKVAFLLKHLAQELTADIGKNFDERELQRIRQFYLTFPIRGTVRPELSWSHYRLLIRVKNKPARVYYLNEAISQHWSTRKLDRNISTQYFQRMLSNHLPKKEVQKEKSIYNQDFIKNPYVLEFLNLPANLTHKEKEIEKAIIAHLQSFLLELGKGFAFVAQEEYNPLESVQSHDWNKEILLCLDSNLTDETVKYFKNNTEQKIIVLERALDTTKKWNLKHYMKDNFKTF